VVAAFEAGGVDYVTKPIRPREVLARLTAHKLGARERRQARNALDAFGHATLAIHVDDTPGGGVLARPPQLVWQTPLARSLLASYFDATAGQVPGPVLDWLRQQSALAAQGREPRALTVARGAKELMFSLQERTGDDDWLIVMREVSDAAVVDEMTKVFRLTMREAEVLYWVVKGKTNRDIGDILGSSPATVKKHLERVYVKLGVETRTAAAGLATNRLRALNPGMSV
jgi:DNA-binding CsgD family transcriptional regulator